MDFQKLKAGKIFYKKKEYASCFVFFLLPASSHPSSDAWLGLSVQQGGACLEIDDSQNFFFSYGYFDLKTKDRIRASLSLPENGGDSRLFISYYNGLKNKQIIR
jgi:hypothetical protein